MTCHRGTSDIVPLPVDFADDDEYRRYLGLPDTAEGRKLTIKRTAEERRQDAQFRAVERELQAGRIPRGVIACDRGRR
ncbi:hypothetical protein HY78_00320 [Rhizorhabdus wittichii DC-6]|nr:hypothetical protein HY78_00320 [Rhizorhabdus wittichii DC-6]